MMKLTAAALMLCACSAFGSPCSSKAACGEKSDVAVSTVAQTSEKSDCAKSCSGSDAVVSTVAMTESKDKGDCATSCTGTDAAVSTVAMTEGKSDCAKACPMTGAAVSTVAMTEDKGSCAKSCDMIKADSGCEGKAECLTKTMPVMMYKVGDETTHCSASACDMASSCESKNVEYVVNDVAYECKVEAREAHMAAMQDYLASFMHVSYNVGGEHMECPVGAEMACEKSGEAMAYQVGPMLFDNAADAVRASAMARGMVSQVTMTYEVDGEKTACSAMACDMASVCESKNVEYVVNDQKTHCQVEAAYLMTQAQCEAAVKALNSTI